MFLVCLLTQNSFVDWTLNAHALQHEFLLVEQSKDFHVDLNRNFASGDSLATLPVVTELFLRTNKRSTATVALAAAVAKGERKRIQDYWYRFAFSYILEVSLDEYVRRELGPTSCQHQNQSLFLYLYPRFDCVCSSSNDINLAWSLLWPPSYTKGLDVEQSVHFWLCPAFCSWKTLLRVLSVFHLRWNTKMITYAQKLAPTYQLCRGPVVTEFYNK